MTLEIKDQPEELKEIPETTFIKITLNRASMGDADNVFAVLKAQGDPIVAWVPKKDIVVDKQKFQGREFTGQLSASILEKDDSSDLVEIELKPGEFRKLRVDRQTHEVVPLKMKAVYYE